MTSAVRAVHPSDVPAWKRLRLLLWPDLSPEENDRDCAMMLADSIRCAILVSRDEKGLTGFIEASLRQFADGCDSSPVGYVEGWFVSPRYRRKGIGRQLVAAAEAWARSRGCSEMASDCLLDNVDSQTAHLRLGYQEVERAVRFRKDLDRQMS